MLYEMAGLEIQKKKPQDKRAERSLQLCRLPTQDRYTKLKILFVRGGYFDVGSFSRLSPLTSASISPTFATKSRCRALPHEGIRMRIYLIRKLNPGESSPTSLVPTGNRRLN